MDVMLELDNKEKRFGKPSGRYMLRSLFLSLSKANWAQRTIVNWPFAWNLASRFVAGETQLAAIEVVRQLNDAGIYATLDHLGENTRDEVEAVAAAKEVCELLDRIATVGVISNVSIKLSQIGLTVNSDLCQTLLFNILDKAATTANFIRIDMEDSSLTEATIALYLKALQRGYDRVGIVIQSYLYRSQADIENICQQGGRIRLCKGAYREPSTVAYPEKSDVDQNYDRLSSWLLQFSRQNCEEERTLQGKIPPIFAAATHDEKRIAHILNNQRLLGLPKHMIEFQMLYGIRRDLQQQLAADGYPVRVYIPYGTHWYPYFMRRLAERPANVWFFVSSLFKK